MERGEKGEIFLPIYIEDRFYLDLSGNDNSGYEELYRHLLGKPVKAKPELGKIRDFIKNNEPLFDVPLITLLLEEIRKETIGWEIGCEDFFEKVINSMEQYRIETTEKQPHELLLETVDKMTPLRDRILNVIVMLVRVSKGRKEYANILHVFFDKLNMYRYSKRNNLTSVYSVYIDSIGFLLNESFLYTIAICLMKEYFSLLPPLLTRYTNPDIEVEPRTQFMNFEFLVKFNIPSLTNLEDIRRGTFSIPSRGTNKRKSDKNRHNFD